MADRLWSLIFLSSLVSYKLLLSHSSMNFVQVVPLPWNELERYLFLLNRPIHHSHIRIGIYFEAIIKLHALPITYELNVFCCVCVCHIFRTMHIFNTTAHWVTLISNKYSVALYDKTARFFDFWNRIFFEWAYWPFNQTTRALCVYKFMYRNWYFLYFEPDVFTIFFCSMYEYIRGGPFFAGWNIVTIPLVFISWPFEKPIKQKYRGQKRNTIFLFYLAHPSSFLFYKHNFCAALFSLFVSFW